MSRLLIFDNVHKMLIYQNMAIGVYFFGIEIIFAFFHWLEKVDVVNIVKSDMRKNGTNYHFNKFPHDFIRANIFIQDLVLRDTFLT